MKTYDHRRLGDSCLQLIRQKLAGQISHHDFQCKLAEVALARGAMSESDFTPEVIASMKQKCLPFGPPAKKPRSHRFAGRPGSRPGRPEAA